MRKMIILPIGVDLILGTLLNSTGEASQMKTAAKAAKRLKEALVGRTDILQQRLSFSVNSVQFEKGLQECMEEVPLQVSLEDAEHALLVQVCKNRKSWPYAFSAAIDAALVSLESAEEIS